MRFGRRASALVLVAAVAVIYLRGIWVNDLLPAWVQPWADATFSTAAAYYEEQRPVFAAVAKGYELYWPFAQTTGIDSLGLSNTQMVTLRLQSWGRLLRDAGRDDFKVEKDKCEMYRFLQRALLPHERILRTWNSSDGVVRDVDRMGFFDGVLEWPIFLKACHLTQGTSQSVLVLPSRNWVAEHKEDISQWVKKKWAFRADDTQWSWREVGNVLTNDLVPGFFVQSPTTLTHDAALGGWKAWEMKVDVIWGRAYTAALCTAAQEGGFFLRSPAGGVEYHRATGIASLAYIGRLVPKVLLPGYVRRIIDGRHLELCVFPLAERLAQTLRIDHIRVDIFIRGDDPTLCTVNEISLSSGLFMNSHAHYIAKIWAQPFVDRTFEVFGNASSKPAYMRTPSDPPRTPRKLPAALPAVRPSHWVPFWQAAGLATLAGGAVGCLAWLLGLGPCAPGDKRPA